MTNKVGTTEVVFDVTIEMPPTIAGNAHEMGVENHVVPLMRSLVLKCEVKGNPMPKISWLKVTAKFCMFIYCFLLELSMFLVYCFNYYNT